MEMSSVWNLDFCLSQEETWHENDMRHVCGEVQPSFDARVCCIDQGQYLKNPFVAEVVQGKTVCKVLIHGSSASPCVTSVVKDLDPAVMQMIPEIVTSIVCQATD